MKFLLVPALFTLTLAGCGKKEQPQPIEPKEETPVDVETEEGKTTVKDAMYKAYLNYSNPQTFKKVNVQADIKDVNVGLKADIIELSQYGENEIDFSIEGFNAKVNAFASIDEQREVEGKVEMSDVKGKFALDLALQQPYTAPVQPDEGQEGEGEGQATQQGLIRRDGEQQGQEGQEPEEPPFAGYFAKGDFTVDPLAVNAYFKDGKVYVDYSNAGVRSTIDNAEDLVGQIMELVTAMNAESEDEEEEEQGGVQQQGLIKREGEQEQPAHYLNAMIDGLTGAPGRKIYTVAEENGFVIEEKDYEAPTEDDKAAVKAEIDKFVDETLPTLVLSQMVTFKTLKGGSYELGISLDKTKVAALISIIEKLQEAREAAEEAQQAPQQGLVRRDGEQQQAEPEQPSAAEIFKQYCEKFNLTAKVVLDKDGFIRNADVSYDIAASCEKLPWDFFALNGTVSGSLALSGKINTSYKYNDEVVFELPADLDAYVCIDKAEDEGQE